MPARPANWNHQYQTLRGVMHGYRLYLDMHEREVLFFIYCRTQMYGKTWEFITYDHFLEGVRNRETGEFVSHPLLMSRPSLRGALKSLREKGIIEVVTGFQRPNNYRIKLPGEIHKDHVEQYVRRHQPKLHAYVQRHLQTTARQPQGRIEYYGDESEPVLRPEAWGSGEPPSGVQANPYGGVPVDPYNSSNKPNSSNLKPASPSGPSAGLRKITLRKRV